MDGYRFDELTRSLAQETSRRRVLKGLAAGLAGGVAALTGRATAAQRATLANGAACSRPSSCQSGFCVDGVCCDGPCANTCEACNLAGSAGACTVVSGDPVGNRGPCGSEGVCAGFCDGINPVTCAFPGRETSCAEPECSNGLQTVYECAGNGTCGPWTTHCPSGVCLQAGCSCANLVLSGGPSPTATIEVDDDLTVFLNGTPIFEDTDTLENFFPPIPIPGVLGDQLRVVATDVRGGEWAISPLYLHCLDSGAVQVLDPVGFRICCTQPVGGVFYDETFTIAL